MRETVASETLYRFARTSPRSSLSRIASASRWVSFSSVTFATRVCAESVLVALVHRLRRPLQVPQAVVRPHVVLVAGLGPRCPRPPERLQDHHVHLPARPSPPHREHHVHVARAYIDL